MCIVIFASEKLPTLLEDGIDIFIDVVGLENDPDFIDNMCGPGKLHPSETTCIFKGKEVT